MYKDIHNFLNHLRQGSGPELATAARDAGIDSPRYHHLLFAAAELFDPEACREAAQYWPRWRKLHDNGNQCHDVAEYWREIASFLPLRPTPAQAVFYEAQRREKAGRMKEALDLYLQVSEEHPLAAACAARLGGRLGRLTGWKKYRGPVCRSVLALQCLAIMMHYLYILRIGEIECTYPHLLPSILH